MGPITYFFNGVIESFAIGKGRQIWYTVLFLPPEVASTLPFDKHPRLRVCGEIAGVAVAGAFMPTGDGRRYFMVSPQVRANSGVAVGDRVAMRFEIDDQDRVDIPEVLQRELDRDAELQSHWERLSPGRQRGLTHLIHSARSDRTIERRLLQVIEMIADAGRHRLTD